MDENSPDIERNQKIEAEKRKLRRQFTKLDAKRKKIAESLIDNAAFMIVTLGELRAEINAKGVTDKYQNGATQFGTKKSPAVEVYNTMIKNHMSIVKQLTDMLPKGAELAAEEENDGFEEFVNRR